MLNFITVRTAFLMGERNAALVYIAPFGPAPENRFLVFVWAWKHKPFLCARTEDNFVGDPFVSRPPSILLRSLRGMGLNIAYLMKELS